MSAPRAAILWSVLGACGLAAAAPQARPAIVWNTTASAPLGFYAVRPPQPIRAGDWVLVRPDGRTAGWLDARGFLPRGALLLKRIAATGGETVCRLGAYLTIDDRLAARARERDRRGRRLPTWSGCVRLGARQVFLLNPAPDSLDGRYLGPTDVAELAGRARPIFTWSAS